MPPKGFENSPLLASLHIFVYAFPFFSIIINIGLHNLPYFKLFSS